MELIINLIFGSIFDHFSVASLSGGAQVEGWRGFTQGEVEKIRLAIQDSGKFDLLKDCLIPFLSAILGGGIAVFVNRTQDINLISKERVYAVNALIIKGEMALNSLNSLKSMYLPYTDINSNRPYRVFEIPILKYNLPVLEVDSSNLGFIFKINRKSKVVRSWKETARINALFSNFQLLHVHLEEITKARSKIDEIVINELNTPIASINIQWLYERLGPADFTSYFYQYEYFIKFADDLIVEFSEFLASFSGEAETILGRGAAKRYGLIKVDAPSDCLLIGRCGPADYALLSKYMCMSQEDLKKRFMTGYPYKNE